MLILIAILHLSFYEALNVEAMPLPVPCIVQQLGDRSFLAVVREGGGTMELAIHFIPVGDSSIHNTKHRWLFRIKLYYREL